MNVKSDRRSPTTVKIFGERNTSTNAVRAMLQQNTLCQVLPSVAAELDPRIEKRVQFLDRLGAPVAVREALLDRVFWGRDPRSAWKHAATNFDTGEAFEGCHVIFCVRHPASWLLGLWRRPYHVFGEIPQSLHGFLDHRWKTVRRERLGAARVTAPGLYNAKLKSYAALQDKLSELGVTYSVVRQEDFAVDQAAVFQRLATALGADASTFEPIEASTKDAHKSREFYADYYGNERWRGEINAEAAARMRDTINWRAVAHLDYAPI